MWLERKGYNIDYWHGNKKSNLPYDILASKGEERWVIDVKTGDKPGVNISNIAKILKSAKLKGYNKIGLALVVEKKPWPYLFEYRKMSEAGRNADLTRRRRIAGKKAADTRKNSLV